MPEQLEQHAHAQHDRLANILRLMWSCEVETVPIILGVVGTVSLAAKSSLEKLGVTGNVYKQLANKLNVNAAVFAEKAWQYRLIHTASERNSQGGRIGWHD